MYEIIFESQAEEFLHNADKNLRERIFKKLEKLKINPLLGLPLIGNLSGLLKLRIGDYRVIYKVDNQKIVIVILKIGHRKKVYTK